MIGEFLVAQTSNLEETLFQDIMRLPASHYMIVSKNGIRKIRYWNICRVSPLRYSSDQDYIDHFLNLFKEAILNHCHSDGAVAAELSGGLDSSSIACVTQSLKNSGLLKIDKFETFSWSYPGYSCDESSYISDAAKKWDLRSNVISPQIFGESEFAKSARVNLNFPEPPNGSLDLLHGKWAPSSGFKVILSGRGGDEWLQGGNYYYHELLYSRRILDVCKLLFNDWKNGLNPNPVANLIKYGIKPMLPIPFRQKFNKLWNPNKFLHRRPWIVQDFAKRIQLEDRLNASCPDTKGLSPMFGYFKKNIIDFGWNAQTFEMEARMQARVGFEKRYPFLDRRLAEFCIAIPEEQRKRNGQKKWILRQAKKDILPESVRARRDKAEFSSIIVETLKLHGGEDIFKSLAINELGWVNSKKLCEMYREMIGKYERGHAIHKYIWPLWFAHAIDITTRDFPHSWSFQSSTMSLPIAILQV